MVTVIDRDWFSGGRNIAEDPDAKLELADLIIELEQAVNALIAGPPAHAPQHVTGGSDVIADAVSGGNSGLMSGADKKAHDSVVLMDVFTAQGDLVFEGGAGPEALAAGAAGDYLASGGAGADPSWVTPGTMISQDAADYMANALITAQGDLVVGDATPAPAVLPIGAAGQVLTVNPGGTDPAWDDVGAAAFVATEAVPGTIWTAPPPVTIQAAIDRIATALATHLGVPIA